ncbi:MAG: proton-conducting transporter membrane subunit [Bacillota bacterium]
MATVPDFFQIFLFWELTTVCSWALISHYGSPEAIRSGLKALAVTQFASLFFIGGLVLLYAQTGSFAFDAVARMTPAGRAAFATLLLVAAWGKAAQVPFFTWLPSAMVAPTPASAFLHAAAMVKAGIFLAARCLVSTGAFSGWVAGAITLAALITLYVGLAGYFYADDLKRLLAFSTIANLALMLVGIGLAALGSPAGLHRHGGGWLRLGRGRGGADEPAHHHHPGAGGSAGVPPAAGGRRAGSGRTGPVADGAPGGGGLCRRAVPGMDPRAAVRSGCGPGKGGVVRGTAELVQRPGAQELHPVALGLPCQRGLLQRL